jgi:hypothetical protein
MSNNKLLLTVYKMEEKQVCLAFKSTDKLYKIYHFMEVLPFAGCMKQLSVAMDTGASQKLYVYRLCCADGLEYGLQCSFEKGVVVLELWFKEQVKFNWRGTAKEFRVAVDRMVLRLPLYF